MNELTFALNNEALPLPNGMVNRDYELNVCEQTFAWENAVDRDKVASAILTALQGRTDVYS